MTSQLIAVIAIVAAGALFGIGVTTSWIVSHHRRLTPQQRHQLFGE